MSRAPMPDSAKGDAPMPSSFDDDLEFWDEGRWTKLTRRLKEEPMIPLGLALTCYALYGAARSIRRGDKAQTNRFFRARVYAQGFTVLCICLGSIYWREDRDKRKQYTGLLAEKRAREKREAWIRELEARDREEEVERKRRQVRKEAARQGWGDEKAEQEERKAVLKVVEEQRVKMEKEKQERERAAEEREQSVGNARALDAAEVRRLVGGSSMLTEAMGVWWGGDNR